MSTLPNLPVAGTTQVWSDSKASDEHEDNKDVASSRSLYVDVFQSTTTILTFSGGVANDKGRAPFNRYS
jgi:hypothetical protein